MNEELQKAITELFNSAIQAKDFLVGELPDYINQLLMWKAVSSGISMLVFVIACIGLVVANKKIIQHMKESDDFGMLPPTLMVEAMIVMVLGIGLFRLDWLKIWIAPKVYLVEYAATLVK